MKKLKIVLILYAILFCTTPLYAQSDERILSFDSKISVNTDTTINIVETITFNPPTGVPKHGLEWTVPYVYSRSYFKRPTLLSINSVTHYPVSNPSLKTFNQYSRNDAKGWAILRIGDPNTYISEPYVYVIDYSLKYSSISFFDKHEEVFLNIIGPGWRFPIENATATLTVPKDIEEVNCFSGLEDSKQENCNIRVEGNTLFVIPNGTLQPYEGYTVTIKQPLGTFDDTRKDQLILSILANIGILLPIPVGMFLFKISSESFKNKRLTVIPMYEPKEGMNSLESAALLSRTFYSKNITAVLIEMAIKGYYKIREYEKNKYEFVKSQKDYSKEPEYIKNLLNAIFLYGDVVPIKKLKNFNVASVRAFEKAKKFLTEEDYISSKKTTGKGIFSTIAIIGFILLLILGEIFFGLSAIGWFLGLSISFLLFFLFSIFAEYKSEKGNEIYHYLLGLKMYIDTAEKERIKFHNDPKRYKEVFESLLPYAIIFGLEKKWANQFEDIYTTPPDWYEGNFTTFNTIYFSNSLSSFNRGVATKASPSNYSSSGGYRSGGWSSGGSGFGGGGSVGGGGGGSGGGSW